MVSTLFFLYSNMHLYRYEDNTPVQKLKINQRKQNRSLSIKVKVKVNIYYLIDTYQGRLSKNAKNAAKRPFSFKNIF